MGGGTALKVHLAQTVCFRMREVGGRDTCTVTYPKACKSIDGTESQHASPTSTASQPNFCPLHSYLNKKYE